MLDPAHRKVLHPEATMRGGSPGPEAIVVAAGPRLCSLPTADVELLIDGLRQATFRSGDTAWNLRATFERLLRERPADHVVELRPPESAALLQVLDAVRSAGISLSEELERVSEGLTAEPSS